MRKKYVELGFNSFVLLCTVLMLFGVAYHVSAGQVCGLQLRARSVLGFVTFLILENYGRKVPLFMIV